MRLNSGLKLMKKLFADLLLPLGLCLLVSSCASPGRGPGAGGAVHDVVIQNGTIYDGSGGAPFVGMVAIRGDRISYLGASAELRGRTIIDADGLAVSPGFINMLSWTATALRRDGKSQSDIRQGVTLEVLGEGSSLGPLNASMRRRKDGTDEPWTTLGQGLELAGSGGGEQGGEIGQAGLALGQGSRHLLVRGITGLAPKRVDGQPVKLADKTQGPNLADTSRLAKHGCHLGAG